MATRVEVCSTRFGTIAVIGSQQIRLAIPRGGSLELEPTASGRLRAVAFDACGARQTEADVASERDQTPVSVARGDPPG